MGQGVWGGQLAGRGVGAMPEAQCACPCPGVYMVTLLGLPLACMTRGCYRPSRGEPRLVWRRSAAGAGPTPISGKTASRLVLAPTFQPRSSSPSSFHSPRLVRSLPACPPALVGGVGPSRLPLTAGPADPCPPWSPPLQPCFVLGPSPTAAQAVFSQSPPQRGPRDPGWGRFHIPSHWQCLSGCVYVPRAPLEGVLVL